MPSKILQEFDKFAKALSPEDRVGVLTDYDTDGITSGAIISRAVLKLTGKMPEAIVISGSHNDPLNGKTFAKFKGKKITKFICADISLEQKGKVGLAGKISKFAKITCIDHHPIYGKLPKGGLLVKPQFFSKKEPVRYCAAKMCFDLFSRVTDLKGSEWLAALGLYGDMGTKAWKSFYSRALKNAGLSEKELMQMSHTLTSMKVLEPERLYGCLEELTNAKKPKGCLKKFYPINDKYQKILEKELEGFRKNSEKYPEARLLLYFLREKHSSKNTVATITSIKIPDWTIIILQKSNGFITISARRQDRKIAVNWLLEKALKGFKDSSSGGHAPAAGGKIREKDFEKFKASLLRILSEKAKH